MTSSAIQFYLEACDFAPEGVDYREGAAGTDTNGKRPLPKISREDGNNGAREVASNQGMACSVLTARR